MKASCVKHYKNMKQLTYLFALVLMFAGTTVNAQKNNRPDERSRNERREDIESMKIAFITKKLDLTPEEAQKFWPVYNQYTNELKTARSERKSKMRDQKDDLANMPDKDVEKMVDAEIASRQQELDINKKYHAQFKQVLPIKKVALLYRSEEDFKRELLERIRERRMENTLK